MHLTGYDALVNTYFSGYDSRMANIPKALRAYMKKLGKKGGDARKLALSPERRSEIAKIAVTARENKRRAAEES